MRAPQNQTLNTKNKTEEKPASRRHRVTIDAERCKGCELCVDVCHNQALVMGSALNARGSHFATAAAVERCGGCLMCALMCPDAAIEIEREED